MNLRYFLAIVFCLTVSGSVTAQSMWEWRYPKPQGNSLKGLILKTDTLGIAFGEAGTAMRRSNGTFLSPQYPLNKLTLRGGSHHLDTMWVVGDSGFIFRSTNNGASWVSQRYSGQHLHFYGVKARDKNNLWVVGDSGYVLYSTNGGASFIKQSNSYKVRLHDVSFAKSNVYTCGDSGTLLRSASYGAAGYAKFPTGKVFPLRGLDMDTNNVFVVGDSGFILRRTFADEAFVNDTMIASPTVGKMITFFDVAYFDRYVIAVGSDGTIKRSIDTGWTWSTPNSLTTEHLQQIKFASDFETSGVAWIVGDGGVFLRSTNYGSTWARLDSGIRATVYAAGRSPDSTLYVTSTGGITFRSTNHGLTWRRDSLSNIGARLMDIAFADNGFGLLATYDSKVLRTLDSGRTWTPQNLGTSSTLILGVAIEDSLGLACGANGQIFRTTNRGSSWSSVTSNTNKTLYDVDVFGGNAIAAGDNGATTHSANRGQTWTSVTHGSTRYNRVRFAHSWHNAVAVAQSGTVARTTNFGQSWTNVTSGVTDHLNDIQFHDDRNGIAVGDRGTIIKTTNAGAAWTSDNSHTINDLKGAIIMNGTDAFVAGSKTTILYTSNSSLPVELMTLKAKRLSGGAVALDWKVASETNNSGFAIDRSTSGGWGNLGFVHGAGTTQLPRSYYYLDAAAPATRLQYRLRQIDLDGSENLLGIVEADALIDEESSFNLWPNPAGDISNIELTLTSPQHVRIAIVNSLGAEVAVAIDKELGAKQHLIPVNTRQFAAGIYQVVIETGTTRTIRNLVIK